MTTVQAFKDPSSAISINMQTDIVNTGQRQCNAPQQQSYLVHKAGNPLASHIKYCACYKLEKEPRQHLSITKMPKKEQLWSSDCVCQLVQQLLSLQPEGPPEVGERELPNTSLLPSYLPSRTFESHHQGLMMECSRLSNMGRTDPLKFCTFFYQHPFFI